MPADVLYVIIPVSQSIEEFQKTTVHSKLKRCFMAYAVEKLEMLLRSWEDYWYLVGIKNRMLVGMGKKSDTSNDGAIRYYRDLRSALLGSIASANATPSDMNRFMAPQSRQGTSNEKIRATMNVTPLMLMNWCRYSRRVFHVKRDLQDILSCTSLEGVSWRDVTLPFSSFAVSLERPFIDADRDAFDFVTLYSYQLSDGSRSQTVIEICFLAKDFDGYQPLSRANKDNIEKRLRKKQWQHVSQLLNRSFRPMARLMTPRVRLSNNVVDARVVDTAELFYQESREYLQGEDPRELWHEMLRVIVGLCLYLETLPPGSTHQSEWRATPRGGGRDSRAISHEAAVCTVSSCYQLTSDESEVFGETQQQRERAAHERCCHFRRGHWRRPPGRGGDELAARTVHVRPTLVRRDRLREGELPGGAITEL